MNLSQTHHLCRANHPLLELSLFIKTRLLRPLPLIGLDSTGKNGFLERSYYRHQQYIVQRRTTCRSEPILTGD